MTHSLAGPRRCPQVHSAQTLFGKASAELQQEGQGMWPRLPGRLGDQGHGGQPWSAQCLEAGLTMVRADGNRPAWRGQWWSGLGLGGQNPECPGHGEKGGRASWGL